MVEFPASKADVQGRAKKAAMSKANLLKLKTEQYYQNLVQQASERCLR